MKHVCVSDDLIQSLRAFRRAGNVKLFGRRLGGLGREDITVQW